MRILVIGATGTIGQAVVTALGARHEIVAASQNKSVHRVDIAAPDSLAAFFAGVGPVNAIVCVAGKARFHPLAELSDEDFQFCLANKLMGQVNVIRHGFAHVRDGGSITVTSGVLAHTPMPGSAAISLVNAGLEGFVRGAALEAPRGIRVNVVSPPWVTETLLAFKMDLPGGRTAADVAGLYAQSVEGSATGATIGF
ncbi:MAG TPA: short chain dehydrogenase [Opitutus sp.]|nr:short chain dehydrogenase [Opitutus sp.]